MAVPIKAFWVQIEPVDPEIGATFPVSFTSLNHPAAVYADGQTPVYWPYLESYPTTSISVFDGEFNGKSSVTIDDLKVSYHGPLLGTQCARAVWDGAKVSLYRGFVDLETGTVQTKTLLVTGALEGNPNVDDGVATFKVVDRGYLLEIDALTKTYLGIGGYEGADGYAGVFRPMAIGYPTNVSPPLIDPNYIIYQYHGHGKAGGVLSLWENGLSFGSAKAVVPWQGSETATFNTLRNVSLALGEWADAPSIGCFRLGGEPVEGGVISCDVEGAVDESGVAYSSFTDCVKYLLSLSVLSGQYDAANFANFQSILGNDVEIGEYIEEQEKIDEVLSRWLAAAGAYYFVNNTGLITLGLIRIGTVPDLTVRSDGRTLPAYEEAKALGVSAPYKTVRVGYQKTFRVQGPTEISDALKQALLKTEYANSGIYDAMLYDSVAEFLGRWDNVDGAPVSRIATTDTGGAAFVFGDNNGADTGAFVFKHRKLPFSPEDVYEVTFDVEAVGDANAKMFLGVATYDANGDSTGATDAGQYAYFAAENVAQNGLTRRTYRGYFRGTANVGGGSNVGKQSNEQANPNPVETGTAWVAPVIVANTNNGVSGGTGAVTIHEVSCRKIEDAAVIATGEWVNTRSYFRNEGVTFNGNYFASRADNNLGNSPPVTATSNTFWFLVVAGAVGGDGADGDSIVEITIFKRSASGAPAVPSGGSYDFDTKVLTPPSGWSTFPPAGSDPCYAARGVAAINGTTGTDTPDWFGVGLAFQNGSNGSDGKSVDVVFQRNTNQPSTPAPSPGTPAGWYTDVNSVPAGVGVIWASFGEKATGATDYTWQTPSQVEGSPGAGVFTWGGVTNASVGPNSVQKTGVGTSWDASAYSNEGYIGDVQVTAQVARLGDDLMIGLNSSSDRASANESTLDFAFYQANSNIYRFWESGSNNGGFSGEPAVAVDDVICIRRRGSNIEYSLNGGTPVVRAGVTSPNTRLFLDTSISTTGAKWKNITFQPIGGDGLSVAELTVFKRSASGAPATPSGGSYDFTTKVLTPPSGWSLVPPAGADPCYAARGLATVIGSTGTDVPDWLGVGLAFQNGIDGVDGIDGTDGVDGEAVDIVFKRSTTQPAVPSPSSGVPSGWYGDTASVPGGSGTIWASFGTRPNPSSNYTWQLPKRVEGLDGADGVDGLTIAPPPPVTIACLSNGTVKTGQLPKSISITVYQGSSNVSASSSYSVAPDADGTLTSAGSGNLSLDAVTADDGEFLVTVTYNGVTAVVPVRYTKAKDGSAASAAQSSAVSSLSASTSESLVRSVTLLVPGGASVSAAFSMAYRAATGGGSPPNSSSYIANGRITLQNTTDVGSPEVTVAGPTNGGTAVYIGNDFSWDDANLSLSGGTTNSAASAKEFTARLYLKKGGGASGGGSGTATVQSGGVLSIQSGV